MGSSPRVRGTCVSPNNLAALWGLIPAGAGNIASDDAAVRIERAHPRGCGEHRIIPLTEHRDWGSSPRVRGTYFGHLEDLHDEGLIPAGAGNIASDLHIRKFHQGSSPRVRGTSPVCPGSARSMGLIPAGAGNMMKPRVTRVRLSGSSPRVRGTYFLTWGFTPIPQVLVLV